MAFDTSTRNRLSKFVCDCRTILTEEFTRQLTRDYGLNPENGTVVDVDTLQLDDAGRETAHILRDTMQHYLTVSTAKPKDAIKEVLQRIVREQAFTVLNRLCALRMAERRDLFIESVGRGIQSDGFQLYSRLAGTALGDTGETYRTFLFGIFDELAVDLPVLFDRFNEHGRLFPSESVLLKVLDEIDDHDLEHLWGEEGDETIGWIYQYFNTAEDRRLARYTADGKPKPPQNSRELAVRNQFFTPRYVVKFLTDNTLGRIWYEMRKGETTLRDECQYLALRPNEIFLTEGEEVPKKIEIQQNKELTQEELLNQPVHIPYRSLKDPREIRMLDPACGSMHFGLYAFDLYLKIYEEFWDLVTSDPSVQIESTDLSPLTDVYESREIFLRDVPRLIIKYNIHGIDIDPRAVQIAGLSLWLRAQKAWNLQGITAGDRPRVTRSNVVCAEPMPGDRKQLESFCNTLHPAVAQMVTAIFEEMKLAGEAGSLLKIEEEISSLVAKAKKQYQDNPPDKKMQKNFLAEPGVVKGQLEYDLSGVTNEQFFEKVEEEIYETLSQYASARSEGGFRRKLFANDAANGFAFIDICDKIFDVALMNPPFGEFSDTLEKYLKQNYPNLCGNILCGFIERSSSILGSKGKLGCIVDKTVVVKSSYSDIRNELLSDATDQKRLTILADLGWGVLDGAQVETVCFTVEKPVDENITFKIEEDDTELQRPKTIFRSANYFNHVPNKSLAYDIPADLLSIFAKNGLLEPDLGDARQGLGISDSWRWYRGIHEIPSCTQSYAFLTNGGGFSPFYREPILALYWQDDGAELKVAEGQKYGSWSRTIKNVSYYFRKGVSFPKRTDHLNAHLLPEGFIFTVEGLGFFPKDTNDEDSWIALCLLNSRLQAYLINRFCGQHKHVGYLKQLPFTTKKKLAFEALDACKQIVDLKRKWSSRFPASISFKIPAVLSQCCCDTTSTLNDVFKNLFEELHSDQEAVQRMESSINNEVFNFFDVETTGREVVMRETASRPPIFILQGIAERSADDMFPWICDLLDYCIGVGYGRFDVKEQGFSDDDSSVFSSPKIPEACRSASVYPSIFAVATDATNEIAELIRGVFKQIWGEFAEDREKECLELARMNSFNDFFDSSSKFFRQHLSMYSFGRREFPIYWPISTESGSYTLWFYYHRLTDQTLYEAVYDFIDPKLRDLSRPLGDLRANKNRSSDQEKDLAELTELASELDQFKAELLEIAAFWKPNLNDGVQITAAPLWKFFHLTKWRNKLKKTWEELQEGKYDWAHLALSVWPDRVIRDKCTNDRSIAIAHDLEDKLWEEVEVTKTRQGGAKKMEWHPRELSDAELNKIVNEVKAR